MAINADEIRKAFLTLGLVGDEKSGILRRFGVILASNSVDFLIDREMDFIESLGTKATKIGEKVLIDAAQWCANATFRGIMDSEEWAKLIEPNISTIKDRFDALVAVTNCLGWGKISSYELDETKKELKFVVDYSYYVEPWLKKSGKQNHPICYMWTGVSGGYLDLLFGSKPNDFVGEETECAAMGAPHCVFIAKKLTDKYGLR